ncbi:histidine kinase [Azorhizobium oxalatiphilum]|uniref:histidine kinase n=1 Tax=Azorhizobium oxalatiphilum TaxID=980631 RepID=A0A917CBB8_9HYPH|nr:PAS domain-containing sensor histidine kinase [Azorhizobium oxalatiphilum]GGF78140.1 histidine kinase [Azorhizobium oxalatiphilum]
MNGQVDTSGGEEADPLGFLQGPGQMADAIRRHDWSATPLGPPEGWPSALKTAAGIMLASRFPKAIVWGPSLTTLYNDAFLPILGHKPAPLGKPFSEIWAEAWDDISELQQRAYAGESVFIEDFPLLVNRLGVPEQTYFTFCYSPIRDERGRVAGMLDTVIESTTKVQAQQQLEVANKELEHRIRNTLGIVGGIAHQTFRSATSLPEARTQFTARLSALAGAHSALLRTQWETAPIESIVRGGLSPYHPPASQIHMTGEALDIPARLAQPLTLAINELAANALKYGALSTPEGTVRVWWHAGQPGSSEPFELNWEESGGPQVAAPSRKGFGTQLVRLLATEFGGEANVDYAPGGIRFQLRAPMNRIGIVSHA